MPICSPSSNGRPSSRMITFVSVVLAGVTFWLPSSNLSAAEIHARLRVTSRARTDAIPKLEVVSAAQDDVPPSTNQKQPGDKQRLLAAGPPDEQRNALEVQRGRIIEIRVDTRLLGKAINHEFAAQNKIDEMILGTRAVGESVTKGQIKLIVEPSETSARFSLRIDGVCEANTRCTQQPVTFESQTMTKFVGHKVISFHPDKGFFSDPATVEAESSSTYRNIRPLRQGLGERLIRRIAAQQIEENRARAENICAERTSSQIETMIDRRVEEKLVEANQRWRLIRLLSGQLMRADSQWLAFNTAEGHVAVSFGKPLIDHSPVILHWTEQSGIAVIVPAESRLQSWAAFLAHAYEIALAQTGHLSQQAIAAFQQLTSRRFANIMSGTPKRLKKSVLDQPPKSDR